MGHSAHYVAVCLTVLASLGVFKQTSYLKHALLYNLIQFLLGFPHIGCLGEKIHEPIAV